MGRLFFRSLFGPRCLCHATVGGVLVLVLVEEKSTAPQQNFVRSPMPLPNFGDRRWRPGPGLFRGELNGAPAKCFFGPRCLCQIFVTVLGVLVLVEENSTALKQKFPSFNRRCCCSPRRGLPAPVLVVLVEGRSRAQAKARFWSLLPLVDNCAKSC